MEGRGPRVGGDAKAGPTAPGGADTRAWAGKRGEGEGWRVARVRAAAWRNGVQNRVARAPGLPRDSDRRTP